MTAKWRGNGHPVGWSFPEETPLQLTVAVAATAACTAVVVVVVASVAQFEFVGLAGSRLAEIGSQHLTIAMIMVIVVVVPEPLAKVVVCLLVPIVVNALLLQRWVVLQT